MEGATETHLLRAKGRAKEEDMDRTALGLIVFVLLAAALAVINRRISPPKKNELSRPNLRAWVPVIASIIIWLIAVFLLGFHPEGPGQGGIIVVIPFLFSLPFTTLATIVYRPAKLPSRFELLAVVLGGGLCTLVFLLWALNN